MVTYSRRPVERAERCSDCGNAADLTWIADTAEDADGYKGDLCLCLTCAKTRTAAQKKAAARREFFPREN